MQPLNMFSFIVCFPDLEFTTWFLPVLYLYLLHFAKVYTKKERKMSEGAFWLFFSQWMLPPLSFLHLLVQHRLRCCQQIALFYVPRQCFLSSSYRIQISRGSLQRYYFPLHLHSTSFCLSPLAWLHRQTNQMLVSSAFQACPRGHHRRLLHRFLLKQRP